MRKSNRPAEIARRGRLLARIQRRYQVVEETIRIGALAIPFTRIREPDRVLDEAVEEEDRREKLIGTRIPGEELHLPYWAELWDSAIGVGQFLVAQRERFPSNAKVLDLGCGMGLTGAVAAALGSNVTLVDLEARALLFAKLNTLSYGPRTRVRRIDWRRDRIDGNFDLIVGADLIYDRKQWEFLEPFWRAHLRADGTVLLGEPGRQTGEMFVDWIRARGWSLVESAEAVPTRDRPIRIFDLRP
jgi:predicted nicotinamide N-methyase